jgi:uncharacterized delta-60 repeat protein
MRTLKTLALFLALLAVLAPSALAAKAGRPDPSFGKGGKNAISIPKTTEAEPAIEAATAPSGKSYVLDGSLLLAFGANGKPEKGFGNNGRLTVSSPVGETTAVTDVATDAEGRILVSGSINPSPGLQDGIVDNKGFGGELPFSDAFVIRYLHDGTPDPTFGSGGEVIVNLTVPLPPPLDGEAAPRYEQPLVSGTQISVLEGNRPVLGGTYYYAARLCYSGGSQPFAFVAPLAESPGTQVIASGAYSVLTEGGGIGAFATTAGGGVAALSSPAFCGHFPGPVSVTTFGPSGQVTPGLEPRRPTFEFVRPGAFATDGQGRTVLVNVPEVEVSNRPVLDRLLPNGGFDPSFGSSGGRPLPAFEDEPASGVAVDAKNRIIVGGGDATFHLMRFGTKGKTDQSFGKKGSVETSFGKGTDATLEALGIDSKGRILAFGVVADKALKTGEGVALARYLP